MIRYCCNKITIKEILMKKNVLKFCSMVFVGEDFRERGDLDFIFFRLLLKLPYFSFENGGWGGVTMGLYIGN